MENLEFHDLWELADSFIRINKHLLIDPSEVVIDIDCDVSPIVVSWYNLIGGYSVDINLHDTFFILSKLNRKLNINFVKTIEYLPNKRLPEKLIDNELNEIKQVWLKL